MALKRVGQRSFIDALAPDGLGRNARLERVGALVKWYRFEKLLSRLRDGGAGRPAYPPLVMFKALLLQQWYGLSDPELEEVLADRLSFRRFCGLSLEDRVPDHSTLCRFRGLLVEAGLAERLFAEFDGQLEQSGLILKRGTLVDATLIEAATGRPARQAEPLDPDAAFAKRQGKAGSTYGYKVHVGVDQGSRLIRAIVTTPANVNETEVADQLWRGDEAAYYGDMAFDTQARRAELKRRGVKDRILHRPNKHHPQLPARLKLRNRLIAGRRAAVETTFAVFKQRMRIRRARYLGLAKTTAQMLMAALAFNMRRAAVLVT